MKFFIDTEFTERPGLLQLISIGIVAENGRTFYAENTSFDEREANDWVRNNVLAKLRWWGSQKSEKGFCNASTQNAGTRMESTEVFGTISVIRDKLIEFFSESKDIKFYGYYADYDWVIFCWIFGRMLDLPDGFPMYCMDLKQMMDERGLSSEWKREMIPNSEDEHNALADAYWNKDLYDAIIRKTIHK